MYEERRETFSVRDIILQILFVILFVLLMVWIFPTKGYMRKFFNTNIKSETTAKVDANSDSKDVNLSEDALNRLSALYSQIFADNVERMKDAAIGYYTNERLPQKVGQSDKMTLNQMYEKHLLLKLIDKDGNYADGEASYVEIIKYENEFRLKVNLKCGSQEDYIIVYLGCYDYCDATGVCEKQKPTTPSTPSKPSTPTPSTKKYVCEYKKTTDGYWTDYGEWSKWTKDPVKASDTTQVETKQEKVQTGVSKQKVQTGVKVETYVKRYATEKYISRYINEKYISGYKDEQYVSGYKDEQYVSGYKDEQYISGYKTQKVKVGTARVQVGTTTKTTTVKVPAGTAKQRVGSGSGPTVPNNTSEYVYVKVGSKTSQSCSSCAVKTTYTWDIYKVVTVYKTEKRTETVPKYEMQDVYKTEKVPVYSTRKVPVYSTRKVPVYATKKVPVYSTRKVPVYATRKIPVYATKKVPVYSVVETPVYETVTYYRSRTRKYVEGSSDIKWSTCDPVDQDLINKGYKKTGNKKAA